MPSGRPPDTFEILWRQLIALGTTTKRSALKTALQYVPRHDGMFTAPKNVASLCMFQQNSSVCSADIADQTTCASSTKPPRRSTALVRSNRFAKFEARECSCTFCPCVLDDKCDVESPFHTAAMRFTPLPLLLQFCHRASRLEGRTRRLYSLESKSGP